METRSLRGAIQIFRLRSSRIVSASLIRQGADLGRQVRSGILTAMQEGVPETSKKMEALPGFKQALLAIICLIDAFSLSTDMGKELRRALTPEALSQTIGSVMIKKPTESDAGVETEKTPGGIIIRVKNGK